MWQEVPKHKLEFAAALSLFFFLLFSITLMKQSASTRLHEWVHWQADFPPPPWGCFLHLMFCDKMLHRSKLEEPNYWHMWRHLHQLCSLQRAVGEGEDGREKGLWQDAQAEIPIPLKNAFLKKKKKKEPKHSRSFTWTRPQWWTWQSSKRSLRNVLTLKTLANRARDNGEFSASFSSL